MALAGFPTDNLGLAAFCSFLAACCLCQSVSNSHGKGKDRYWSCMGTTMKKNKNFKCSSSLERSLSTLEQC